MSVLEATPPSFSADDVARIAAELFGLDGTVTDLGSERDQTLLVEGPSGSCVVKISNLGEQAATLDLEAEAILHIALADPELPVARPQVSRTLQAPRPTARPSRGRTARISCGCSSGYTGMATLSRRISPMRRCTPTARRTRA